MKILNYLNKIISLVIIFTFISTSSGYSYESKKSTLRVPLKFEKDKRPAGYITKSQHKSIRTWLKKNDARKKENRRVDLEKRYGLNNLIKIYVVPSLPIVFGHYAIRDRIVYITDERHLNEELYELLAIIKEGAKLFGDKKIKDSISDLEYPSGDCYITPKLNNLMSWFKGYVSTTKPAVQRKISQRSIAWLENKEHYIETARLLVSIHNNAPKARATDPAENLYRLELDRSISKAMGLIVGNLTQKLVGDIIYEYRAFVVNEVQYNEGKALLQQAIEHLRKTGDLEGLLDLRSRIVKMINDASYKGGYVKGAIEHYFLTPADNAIESLIVFLDHPVRGAATLASGQNIESANVLKELGYTCSPAVSRHIVEKFKLDRVANKKATVAILEDVESASCGGGVLESIINGERTLHFIKEGRFEEEKVSIKAVVALARRGFVVYGHSISKKINGGELLIDISSTELPAERNISDVQKIKVDSRKCL